MDILRGRQATLANISIPQSFIKGRGPQYFKTWYLVYNLTAYSSINSWDFRTPPESNIINTAKMGGGGVGVITGTSDTSRIEAPITLKAYLICAFAAFGGIFFGYDTGWMGGVLAMKFFIRQYTGMPYPDPTDKAAVAAFHLPASDQSLTTSILSCGTFFGALIAGDCADFIGRRVTIITGCGIFTVGCILETASTGLGVMVAGRLIAGAGVGFISAIVILYMSVRAFKPLEVHDSEDILTPC